MDGAIQPSQVLPVAIFVDAPNILISIRDGLIGSEKEEAHIDEMEWTALLDYIIYTVQEETGREVEVEHAGLYCPNYFIADVVTKQKVLEAREAEFTLYVEHAKDVDRLIVDDIWDTVVTHCPHTSADPKLEIIIVSGDGDFARTAERILKNFEGVAFRIFGHNVNSVWRGMHIPVHPLPNAKKFVQN